jgi:hypothetical protein
LNKTTPLALTAMILVILAVGTVFAFDGFLNAGHDTSTLSATTTVPVTLSPSSSSETVTAAASSNKTTTTTASDTTSTASTVSEATRTTTTTTSSTNSSSPPPRSPATYTLQVVAQLPNGTALKGLTAQIGPSGHMGKDSPLPAAMTLSGGIDYTVTVADEKGFLFTHWSSGETAPNVSVLLSHDTSLVAFYRPLGVQTLSVVARLLDGKSVVGVRAYIISHQQTPATSTNDTIPANVTASYGQTYTIIADSASSVAFKYWNNDPTLTNESYTATVTGNSTITAYYQQQPLPYMHSGKGNHTITVVAHTMDGGIVVGAYFQVRIHAVWNHVADGFTPASVTVPDGNEELVMYHCAQVAQVCADKFFVYRYYNNTTPDTLTRWQYINLQSDMVVNSFYEVIPASDAVHATMEAVNSTGPIFINCTCGSVVTIYSADGTPVAQSLQPYSFWLWKGQNYTVTVGDLPGYNFVGWTTGSASYTISFTAQPQGADPYYQYFAAIYAKKA